MGSPVRDTTITFDGLTFDVREAGERGAPLVLLLHGFPQTNHTWREQLPALAAEGLHAVAPNQRGYSPRARPAGVAGYATGLLLDDALRFADACGAARFHLVGHDWGGQVAWLVAAHYPERVQSLTVLSRPHPAAFAAAMKADPLQAERSGHHRAFLAEDAADRLLENDRLARQLREQGVAEADVQAYLEPLSTRAALNAAIHWYRAAARAGAALVGTGVPKVDSPTLYLWGNRDATVGRVAAEGTAAQVRGEYRFRELERVGHFVTDQAATVVTDELLAHVARHAG